MSDRREDQEGGQIGLPAYQRVADDIRAKITEGVIKVGDPIPSTAQLCSLYGVSATVARAAVAQLRNDNIVKGQPGKAVYVVGTPESVSADQLELAQVAADVEALRGSVAELRAHLIDLYGRTGNDYPHESAKPVEEQRRETAG